MVEWMGEGSFDPYVGLWSLIDISHSEIDTKKGAYAGEALILTDTPVQVGDFEVSIEEEKLAASPISKGVLTRSLNIETAEIGAIKPELDRVLELVTYNTEIDVVTSVNHFTKDLLQKGIKINSLPKVNFTYSAQTSNLLTIENLGEEKVTDLYNRANRVIDKFNKVGDRVMVDEEDFYLMYSPENAYYIRWVNKYDVHPPPSAWKKDPVVVTLIIVVICMFLMGIGIRFIEKPVTTEIPKPQRVAKVEIVDYAQKPVEVAPPPPVYEQEVKKEELQTAPPVDQVQEKKPEAKPTDKEPPKQTTAADKSEAQKAKALQNQGKRATVKNVDENLELSQGLNQKGEIKNVNSVGLLGKLGGSKKTGSGISAEAVIAKVKPTDSASGESGKVKVLQPPMGKVNLTNTGKTQADDGEDEGLSAAATTLKMDNVAKGAKISGMASSKATGSIGTGAFGGNQKDGEGNGSIQSLGGNVALETKAMEVQGGLTKEQVRQAIADNRRALRNCHEQFLTYKKDLGGRLVLRWKISGEGPVDTISTQLSNTAYPNFDSCVSDVVKKIVFPKAPNSNSTIVIYPFLFQPKK